MLKAANDNNGNRIIDLYKELNLETLSKLYDQAAKLQTEIEELHAGLDLNKKGRFKSVGLWLLVLALFCYLLQVLLGWFLLLQQLPL